MAQDIFFNSCREMNSFAVTFLLPTKKPGYEAKILNHEIDYVLIARDFQCSTQVQSTNILENNPGANIATKSKCCSLPKYVIYELKSYSIVWKIFIHACIGIPKDLLAHPCMLR